MAPLLQRKREEWGFSRKENSYHKRTAKYFTNFIACVHQYASYSLEKPAEQITNRYKKKPVSLSISGNSTDLQWFSGIMYEKCESEKNLA